jgi:dihydroceramidase
LVFATIVLTVALRITYLLKRSELAGRIPDQKKAIIGTLFSRGAAMFALGFLIWNLDNIFCSTLTRWKVFVGWPRAFLLEGMIHLVYQVIEN